MTPETLIQLVDVAAACNIKLEWIPQADCFVLESLLPHHVVWRPHTSTDQAVTVHGSIGATVRGPTVEDAQSCYWTASVDFKNADGYRRTISVIGSTYQEAVCRIAQGLIQAKRAAHHD